MLETWLPIEGYGNCYSISNLGRVMRTSPRNIVRHPTKSRAKPFTSSLCKAFINRGGYPQVRIGPTGNQVTVCVHRLVAITFVPNPDDLPEVNHIDGKKTNNIQTNLEWVTHSRNLKHAAITGLQKHKSGEQSARSKLTDKQVVSIRSDNRTAAVIADEYQVSRNTIYIVKQRRGWKHII